jgi:hypothetical protein
MPCRMYSDSEHISMLSAERGDLLLKIEKAMEENDKLTRLLCKVMSNFEETIIENSDPNNHELDEVSAWWEEHQKLDKKRRKKKK